MRKANRDRATASVLRRAQGFTRRGRQSGQALIWFLATAASCCAVLALVYTVGQVTNEKEKTINAADAAALSGALVEARMLNFISYSNRAMIANEETIAQILSLDSWVRFNNNLVQNATYIPIVGAFIEPFSTALQTFTYEVADPMASYGIPLTDKVVTGIAATREAANGLAVAAANEVATSIAQANQTNFTNATTGETRFDAAPSIVDDNGFGAAAFLLNQKAWNGFSKVYAKDDGGNDDRGGAAQVVVDSRDGFSQSRGLGVVFDKLNDLPTAVTGVEKTSKTTYLRDYDHWEASDSADIWVGVQVTIFGHTISVAHVDTLPVGWGRADANQNGDEGEDWDFGNGPCKQYIALGCEAAYLAINPISGWSGIPEIRDLNNPGSGNTNDTLTFVVAVKKSGTAAMTTQRLGSGMNNVKVSDASGSPSVMGSPDMQDNLQGNANQLAALSAARVFFARPDWNASDKTEGTLPRADKAHEYASLYNPYWQARLTDPNSVKIGGIGVKTLLYAALGQAGLNCAADLASC